MPDSLMRRVLGPINKDAGDQVSQAWGLPRVVEEEAVQPHLETDMGLLTSQKMAAKENLAQASLDHLIFIVDSG